jgi:hypothetical protein
MAYNLNVRNSIYKWRQTHKEQYNEYINGKTLEYYYKNKTAMNTQRVKRAKFHQECQRLRSILIE